MSREKKNNRRKKERERGKRKNWRERRKENRGNAFQADSGSFRMGRKMRKSFGSEGNKRIQCVREGRNILLFFLFSPFFFLFLEHFEWM